MFPVLLAVVLGVIGYDEDLVGVTVEILVFTDPDEVLQNVVPEQIAEAKADSGCKVPREAASPIGLLKSDLPQEDASLLHVVIRVKRKQAAVLQSLGHDDGAHALGELFKHGAI